jgi:hypothetical protein
MKKRLRRLCVPLVVATLVAGCGGDDTVDPEPLPAGPPDVTGTYSLVSLTGVITQGATIGPPIAVGTAMLSQNPGSGDSATGTMSMSLTVTNPLNGEVTEIADQGTFTLRTDGSWEYLGQLQQNIGTYTLAGNVLTVIVTEPPAAVATTVWQRQ